MGLSQQYERYACRAEESENMMPPYHTIPYMLMSLPRTGDARSTTEQSPFVNSLGESRFLLPAERPTAQHSQLGGRSLLFLPTEFYVYQEPFNITTW